SDLDFREPGNRDDIARISALRLDPLESVETEQTADPGLRFRFTVGMNRDDGLTETRRTPLDTADRQPPEVRREIHRRDQHLKRPFGPTRLRDRRYDGLEERRQVVPRVVQVIKGKPFTTDCIEEGAVEL